MFRQTLQAAPPSSIHTNFDPGARHQDRSDKRHIQGSQPLLGFRCVLDGRYCDDYRHQLTRRSPELWPRPGVSHTFWERNSEMKPITLFTLLFSLLAGTSANAQTPTPAKYRICMDVAHQQRFWHDPADMPGMDVKLIERVKYMTGELSKDRCLCRREPVLPEERSKPQRPGRMRPAVHPYSFGEVHNR